MVKKLFKNDFKFYLDKLNSKKFPHMVQVFTALNNIKKHKKN